MPERDIPRQMEPDGLGAVNDNPMGGAIDFKSGDAKWGQGIEAGIHATVAHILTYVEGHANPWWNEDPRATAVEPQYLAVSRSCLISTANGRDQDRPTVRISPRWQTISWHQSEEHRWRRSSKANTST